MSQKKGTMIPPFYREGNWNTERMCNLPTVTEFLSGIAGAWTQAMAAWVYTLNHNATLFLKMVTVVVMVEEEVGVVLMTVMDDDPLSLAPC